MAPRFNGRRILVSCASLLMVGAGAAIFGQNAKDPGTAAAEFQKTVLPVLSQQCFACHSDSLQTAGLSLEAFHDGKAAIARPNVWRAVREKLNGKLMPPPPVPGLSAEETAAVVGWIDSTFGKVETPVVSSAPDPGRVTARRLNRIEYNHTIRDLLGVTIHPADEFPVDNQGYGFDNIGDVLSLSPMLMEKFVAAAHAVAKAAIYGEPYEKTPSLLGHYLTKSIQDDAPASGNTLPYSMRGSLDATIHFPVEADYELQFRTQNRRGREANIDDVPPAGAPGGRGGRGGRGGAGAPGAAGANGGRGRGGAGPGRGAAPTPEQLAAAKEANRKAFPPVDMVATLDGKEVMRDVMEGNENYAYDHGAVVGRVHVTAGDHLIHASFPSNADLATPRGNIEADGRRVLTVDGVDVIGPYNPSPAHPTSYDRIFICKTRDAACARKIVENLATRAFRRPVTEAETQKLLKLTALVRQQGDSFEEGIRVVLQSILISPNFLFRVEHDPAPGQGVYQLNDYELATRLSYFLWSSMPDEELRRVAGQHKLKEPIQLNAQIQRMLADPKSSNLVNDFAVQWLDLRALDRKKPDPAVFPTVDDELLAAMRQETLLFMEEIVREDRSVLDVIDGRFTYVNGPLARYYGIPGVNGEKFQRVELDGTQRAGILTQASILTLSSYATRTSPVIRGKWVLENLLGAAPPPPPPNVPALDVQNLGTDASVRERLEQHRANPACAVCHKQMDPIGFGLENYNAAGGWRTKEGRFDIDSSGTLPDGRTFHGSSGLREVLRSQADAFTRNLAEKLFTFALGRGAEPSDQTAIEQIAHDAAAHDYRFSALVNAIVNSSQFQTRSKATGVLNAANK